jgi:hypothetical protein
MVALPSDVARSGAEAKRAYETVFKAMVSVLERSLRDRNRPRHVRARAIAALCVGGMIVARSTLDRALGDELRNACMATALQLGGWSHRPAGKPDRRSKSALRRHPGV